MQRLAVNLRIRIEYASFAALATMVAIVAGIAGVATENLTAGGAGTTRPARSLSTGNVTLDYPPSWRPAPAPRIAGLDLRRPVALAFAPSAGRAGLIVGEASGAGGSPLPRGLLARLAGPAPVEVVTFGGFDAYRYARLRVDGFNGRLTVYSVPGGRHPTIAACYASAGAVGALRRCEGIVASFYLDSTVSYALAPSPVYARATTAAIAALNARRRAERAGLQRRGSAGTEAAVATRLAGAYDDAAGAMSATTAPAAIAEAHHRLVAALRSGAAAYRALASSAGAQDPAGYARARAGIGRAEAAVGAALDGLTPFGYGAVGQPRARSSP